MKRTYKYKSLSLLLMVWVLIGSLVSCDDDEVTYINANEIIGDVNLEYTDITDYPYQIKFQSDVTKFEINPETAVYGFTILEITMNGQGDPVNLGNKADIDPKTGQITIDNKDGGAKFEPGNAYHFNIGIQNVNGVMRYDDAFVFTVLDMPLDYQIDKDKVDAEYLFEGPVATVTYVDTSGDDVIANVTYSLVNPPEGFSIDSDTGVITKDTNAETGEYQLSVEISTNMGAKEFKNILTVTVGPSPTLNYVQADGSTQLANVVLSPWTEYETSVPQLEGMTAETWELVLPQDIASQMVIIKDDGRIKVRPDKNIPVGSYEFGVIVTNSSGISATFDNVFKITVETRWEPNAVFLEDFNNAAAPVDPNAYNPMLYNYDLNGSNQSFDVVHTFSDKAGKEKDLFTVKLSDDGKKSPDEIVDAALVLKLDIAAEWRMMRVAFNEDFGYGDDRITWYERSFQSAYDVSDLEGGSFNDANWNTIMAPDHADWTPTSGWANIHVDSDLHSVPFQNVELDATNSSIYLNWRVRKTAQSCVGGKCKTAAFLIDDIEVEVAKAFPAEEQ